MIRGVTPLLHFAKVALYLVPNDKSLAFSAPSLLRGEGLSVIRSLLLALWDIVSN